MAVIVCGYSDAFRPVYGAPVNLRIVGVPPGCRWKVRARNDAYATITVVSEDHCRATKHYLHDNMDGTGRPGPAMANNERGRA